MEKIRVLIVEDEPIIAKDLSYTLEDIGYEVAGIAYEADSALQILENQDVDLALLDINIDGDINGIQVGEKIADKYNIPFIYVTSFSDKDTIHKAANTEPMGYLVKPINEKDLLSTIEIALYNFNKKSALKNEKLKNRLNDTIFIKDAHAFIKVKIEEIHYAEAQDNYTFIHTAKKKFLLSSTLKLIEERLRPWDFIRIHRSYLINPDKIIKVEDGYVYIEEKPLSISKKYKKDFLQKITTI